ncbi:MAG TPA: hypothetical protein VKS24_09780 [Bradyrhizobium sp.]|nr:hypothetical protein [Bradyrhizobium sp.]
MNQQSASGLAVREAGSYGSIWPTIFGRLLLLCAATVVVLLLIAESQLPSEQRQQVFDASVVYP